MRRSILALLPKLTVIAVGCMLFALPARAELSLENVSKKPSLWPDEVTVTQKISYRAQGSDGETALAHIPKDELLPLIAVRPEGLEIKYDGKTMLIPYQYTDLEPRIVAIIKEIGERQRQLAQEQARQEAQRPPAPSEAQSRGALDGAGFTEEETQLIVEANEIAKQQADLNPPPLTEAQRQKILRAQQLLNRDQESSAAEQETPAEPTPQRPQPRTQSPVTTEFIKNLEPDLRILRSGSVLDFGSLQFEDQQYFVFVYARGNDESTVDFVETMGRFYNDLKDDNARLEFIFVSMDRSRADMEQFILDVDLPFPLIEHARVREREDIVGLLESTAPGLVLTDRQGQVLSSTYANGEPRKLREVMKDILSVLGD